MRFSYSSATQAGAPLSYAPPLNSVRHVVCRSILPLSLPLPLAVVCRSILPLSLPLPLASAMHSSIESSDPPHRQSKNKLIIIVVRSSHPPRFNVTNLGQSLGVGSCIPTTFLYSSATQAGAPPPS